MAHHAALNYLVSTILRMPLALAERQTETRGSDLGSRQWLKRREPQARAGDCGLAGWRRGAACRRDARTAGHVSLYITVKISDIVTSCSSDRDSPTSNTAAPVFCSTETKAACLHCLVLVHRWELHRICCKCRNYWAFVGKQPTHPHVPYRWPPAQRVFIAVISGSPCGISSAFVSPTPDWHGPLRSKPCFQQPP